MAIDDPLPAMVPIPSSGEPSPLQEQPPSRPPSPPHATRSRGKARQITVHTVDMPVEPVPHSPYQLRGNKRRVGPMAAATLTDSENDDRALRTRAGMPPPRATNIKHPEIEVTGTSPPRRRPRLDSDGGVTGEVRYDLCLRFPELTVSRIAVGNARSLEVVS